MEARGLAIVMHQPVLDVSSPTYFMSFGSLLGDGFEGSPFTPAPSRPKSMTTPSMPRQPSGSAVLTGRGCGGGQSSRSRLGARPSQVCW